MITVAPTQLQDPFRIELLLVPRSDQQSILVTFFVAYAQPEIHDASKKHAFWTTLDRAVKDIPRHEQLLVLMDANARTGRREK